MKTYTIYFYFFNKPLKFTTEAKNEANAIENLKIRIDEIKSSLKIVKITNDSLISQNENEILEQLKTILNVK